MMAYNSPPELTMTTAWHPLTLQGLSLLQLAETNYNELINRAYSTIVDRVIAPRDTIYIIYIDIYITSVGADLQRVPFVFN